MEFTFGIITDGIVGKEHFINEIIRSIVKQNIEKYEIIIIGNCKIESKDNILVIPFDETIKPAWITKKKNIICQMAKYENVVLLHDYVVFQDGWYEGYIKYGNDFLITSNIINNLDNSRYIDYTFFPHNLSFHLNKGLIPYDIKPDINLNKFRYYGGYYYVIKKSLALEYPLDENRVWCQGEDVDLCVRLSNHGVFLDFNPYSTVQFLKQKCGPYWVQVLTNEEYEEVKEKLLDKDTFRHMIEGIIPVN